METANLVTILASTTLFTLIHVWIWRSATADLPRAFKLSRGIAALVLTLLGVAALIGGSAHWSEGYLYRHEPGDWMGIALCIVYGHFLSDLIWMAYMRVRLGVRPRRDLIFHHLLGLVAFAVALWLEIGYAIALVVMASEIMPCFTALEALGRHVGSPRLERSSARARLAVLVFWRIPLWGFLLLMLIRTLAAGELDPGLVIGYRVAIGGLFLLLGLDLFWVKTCMDAVATGAVAPKEAVLTKRLDDRPA